MIAYASSHLVHPPNQLNDTTFGFDYHSGILWVDGFRSVMRRPAKRAAVCGRGHPFLRTFDSANTGRALLQMPSCRQQADRRRASIRYAQAACIWRLPGTDDSTRTTGRESVNKSHWIPAGRSADAARWSNASTRSATIGRVDQTGCTDAKRPTTFLFGGNGKTLVLSTAARSDRQAGP